MSVEPGQRRRDVDVRECPVRIAVALVGRPRVAVWIVPPDCLTRATHRFGEALAGAQRTIDMQCERARRLLAHRHHLVDELHRLTLEMSAGLAEVAEEGSWVKGQTESLKKIRGLRRDIARVKTIAGERARSAAGQKK